MSKIEKTALRKISVTQLVFIGFVVIAGLVGLGWLMNHLNLESWDFRNNLWAPVSLLVKGMSPYNIEPLNPEGRAVWFPVVIGFFFLFGWLPFSSASVLWLVLNIGLVIALVILAAHGEKPRIIPFTLGLLVIFLHPRIIAHLQLGQYTIFATTLFLFAAYAVSKEKILLTAVLVAIALAKPQLGFLIVPGIAVACFRWYGSKQAASYFLCLLGVTVLFSVPLFIGYWNWIPDFFKTLQENPGWAQPSLVSILQTQMGPSGLLIWLILAIMFSLLNGWIWYRLPPTDAIYWSLALTPLITPYIWSWDFVMLMPLFVRTLYELRRIPSYLVLLGGYGVIWWLMFQVIMQTNGDDQYFIWVSWATFLLILVALALEKMMGEHPALTVNFRKVATG